MNDSTEQKKIFTTSEGDQWFLRNKTPNDSHKDNDVEIVQVLKFIKNHDAESFLNWEIQNRKTMNFPPFSVLAKIIISHENRDFKLVIYSQFVDEIPQ